MAITLATASPGGSLMLWDPRGPVIYWQTTYSEGDCNSLACFGMTGCVSVRTRPALIYLFVYDNTTPKFKFTAPFNVELAFLHGQAEGCDADYLFLCGGDGQLGIWSLATGSLLGILQLHSRAITTLDFWKNYLLTGSKDGTISLWSLPNLLTALYANKVPQQIATSTEHAFSLVSVKFDKYTRAGNIVFYSVAEKGHLRRWSLVEATRGFRLLSTMVLLAPSTPLSIDISPTGTTLYLLTAKSLYSVVLGGPALSEKLIKLGEEARQEGDNAAITKVMDVPETAGKESTFTAFASSPATQTILLGLSTGQVMALFPGSGFQLYRCKESLPIRNMTVLPYHHSTKLTLDESKQPTCMQTNLSRIPTLKRELALELLKNLENNEHNMLSFGQMHKETPSTLAPLGLSAVPCTVMSIKSEGRNGEKTSLCTLELLQEELLHLDLEQEPASSQGVDSADRPLTTATRIGVSSEEYVALAQRNLELEAKISKLTAHVAKLQLLEEGGYY